MFILLFSLVFNSDIPIGYTLIRRTVTSSTDTFSATYKDFLIYFTQFEDIQVNIYERDVQSGSETLISSFSAADRIVAFRVKNYAFVTFSNIQPSSRLVFCAICLSDCSNVYLSINEYPVAHFNSDIISSENFRYLNNSCIFFNTHSQSFSYFAQLNGGDNLYTVGGLSSNSLMFSFTPEADRGYGAITLVSGGFFKVLLNTLVHLNEVIHIAGFRDNTPLPWISHYGFLKNGPTTDLSTIIDPGESDSDPTNTTEDSGDASIDVGLLCTIIGVVVGIFLVIGLVIFIVQKAKKSGHNT